MRKVNFEERSIAKAGKNLFILSLLVIILCFFACVGTAEETVYPSGPRERPSHFPGIEGPWYINAGGSPGKLEFYRDRNAWRARVWFDYRNEWEELIGIFFDPRTNRLEFTRPNEDQRYYGTVRANKSQEPIPPLEQ